MSRTQQYQASFTVGELDPLLRGRIDLQQYYSSVDLADNVVFEPQGGFSRRPGTRFVHDLTADNPSNSAMLIPFEFSTTQKFMIVATALNLVTIRFRFFADQTLITGINGTSNSFLDYTTGSVYLGGQFDLQKLYFTQSADTLIIVHENLIPFKITRGANNQTWTTAQIALKIPFSSFAFAKTNPSGTITPDAVTGIAKVTASAGVFSESSVDQYINVVNDFGRARIYEYVSSTVVKVITEVPFAKEDEAIAAGAWELETGYEPSWSGTRGWPRTCTFHEGRLYFGGSASEPSTIFGSKVGSFFNLRSSEGLDDDAIKVTLSTDRVNAITALRSGRDLQIFTTGAEFFVPQADLTPITPGNITIKSATRRGSKLGLRPQAAEGGTLFMSKEGKSLREMLFSDVELSYVANNISLLCSHMILDPQRMALRTATDTTEGDLLLVVNGSDTAGYRSASKGFAGNIAAFMLNRPQQIVAASTFSTDGDFIDVAVDGDTIYCIVKRTIGSATKFYIETFDDDRTTDCSLQYYANPVAPDQALPSNTTAGSLAHIQGEVVNIIRDDIVDANDTVASGNVTLGGVPSVYAEVGLPFTPTVTTQPFEPRAKTGSSQSARRRILEVTPIVDNTQNLTLQGKEVQLQTLPLSGTGSVPTFTGVKKQMGFLGYSRDAQITISQSQPVFFTVLALDYKVSVGS